MTELNTIMFLEDCAALFKQGSIKNKVQSFINNINSKSGRDVIEILDICLSDLTNDELVKKGRLIQEEWKSFE